MSHAGHQEPGGARLALSALRSLLPRQHLVEYINRTAIDLALYPATTRDDQRGCPLAPREAISTETFDKDEVNPVAADAVPHERAILARRRS